MKMIFKFILTITLIMIVLCNCCTMYSLANRETQVYYKEDCGKLLKRDGKILTISFAVFNNNGKESPIYCLDRQKPGVGEVGTYTVDINEVIKDVRIWRAIKNGYPYKTPEQLNCANSKEAFAATKMAVYSVLYGYTIDNFEAIGEAGERTWNALNNILNQINNLNEKPLSPNIEIIDDTKNWKQDETNKNNIYKLISVKSEADIKKYNVFLGENYPEGTIITDKNNNYRESFSQDEQFKISIPIKELDKEGIINLKVIGEVKTNPIYIGKSLDENNQDYAITEIELEHGEGGKNLKYYNNKTALKIIKKDENDNKLQGAIFELLDKDKKVLKTNLTTNQNGEIYIENLMPGRYYIREIKEPEGYIKYNQDIEINLKFNEELSVIIKNQKEEEPTIEIERDFIEINRKEK